MKGLGLLLAFILLPLSSFSANLLANPSFEDGWGIAWSPWGDCSVEPWAAETGTNGAAFHGWVSNSYAGFLQEVGVTSHPAGDVYTFSIRGKADTDFRVWSNDSLQLRVEFFESGDFRGSVSLNAGSNVMENAGSWSTYALTCTNTVTSVNTARVMVFAYDFKPVGPASAVMWDDAVFSAVDLGADRLFLAGEPGGYTGASNLWTVTHNGATSTPVTVNLSCDRPEVAGVPGSVVVPEGFTSCAFHVALLTAGVAMVTAQAPGYAPAEQGLYVKDRWLILSGPTSVWSDTSNTWMVTRRAPLEDDLTVDLVSADPAVASVPVSVVMASLSSTATFSVNATTAGLAAITASAPNHCPDHRTIEVRACSLSLAGGTHVYEGDSNLWSVYRNGPLGNELIVDLDNGDPSVFSVPASVAIPAEELSATFAVAGLHSGAAVITASATGYEPAARMLVVSSNALSLSGMTQIQLGYSNLWAVTRTGSASNPVTVTLTSSDPEVLSAAGSVEVPSGATSSVFWVTGASEGTATVTATASGYLPAMRAATPSSVINLLVDPGFEDPTGWGSVWRYWSQCGMEPWAAEAGSQGVAFYGWLSNEGAGLLQDVAVGSIGPTSVFCFSISGRADPGFANYGHNMSLEMWVSATPHGYGFGVSNNVYNALVTRPGTWNRYSLQLTNTDPNVVSVTVHIWCDWFRATGELSAVMWDNASLEISAGLTTNLAMEGVQSLYTGTSNMWTVSRSGDPSVDLLVSLSNDNPVVAAAPPSVLLEAGDDSATFHVAALSTGSATIFARAPGYPRESRGITVMPNSLTLAGTNPLYAGFSSQRSVTRTGPTDNPLAVRLASSKPSVVHVETQVIIGASATSATFSATGVAPGSAVITASATSFVPATCNMAVSPAALMLNGATRVYQGLSNLWTVARDGPREGDLEVTLAGDDPSVASVPLSLTIPDGEAAAEFAVAGADPGTTTVRAAAALYPAASQDIVVEQNLLALSGDRALAPGQSTSWTVSRTGPMDQVVTVTITSDTPSVVTGDLFAVIAEGSTSTAFSVHALAEGTATVWATATGYAPASRVLAIDDNLLDDPGFEEPDGWGSVWEGWGEASEELWAAESGQKGVCFQGWWMGGFAGFRQTVPVQPPNDEGNFYAFSIHARTDPDFRTSNRVVWTLMDFLDGSSNVGKTVTNALYDLLLRRPGEWGQYDVVAVDTNIFTRYVRVSALGEEFSASGGLSALMWDNADLRVQRLSVTNLFLYGGGAACEGQSNLWTVARGGSLQDNLTVSLSVDDPSVAEVPVSVTIPFGSPSASFYVSVQDQAMKNARASSRARAKRDGGVTAIITAAAPDYPQTNKDITATGKTLDIGGNSRVGVDMSNRWMVTRTGPLDSALTVDLASTDPGVAAVPPTVGISADEASAEFFVAGVSTGATVITASASDYLPDTQDAEVTELVPDIDMQEPADRGITWYASSGLTYRVEETYGLTGTWFTVHTFLATSDCIRTWRDAYPPGSDKVFYRIFLADTNAGSSY